MASAKTHHYILRKPGSSSQIPSPEYGYHCSVALDNQAASARAHFPMNLQPSYHDERRIYRALQNLTPSIDVERIEKLPTARIQAMYNLSLADGKIMVLTGPPEANSRQPLRSEHIALLVEAAAVTWLASLPPQGPQSQALTNHVEHGECRPGLDVVNYTGDSVNVNYVSQFLPRLDRFIQKSDMNHGNAFALWEPTSGITVAQLGRKLTTLERKEFNTQTGQLFGRLACHVSPTGNFGPIGHVLRTRSDIPYFNGLGVMLPRAGEETPSDIGSSTWSGAFKGYMNSVAGDLGDFYVNVRFDVFERHYQRFKSLLDEVNVPKLVAIQGACDRNVMVSIKGETDKPTKSGWTVKGHHSPACSRSSSSKVNTEDRTPAGSVRVTGLRDWSFFCFGDPLMAHVFQEGAPTDFRRGAETSFSQADPLPNRSLVEDEEHAAVRLLLYKAWHAACGIAREYRRVGDFRTDREEVHRNKFDDALDALDTFNDNGKRMSDSQDEGSPSKRARSAGNL